MPRSLQADIQHAPAQAVISTSVNPPLAGPAQACPVSTGCVVQLGVFGPMPRYPPERMASRLVLLPAGAPGRAVASSNILARLVSSHHHQDTSCPVHHPVHRDIAQIVLVGHVLRVDLVFLQHVPFPVILPWEGFCSLSRIFTPGLPAIELASFEVLVVLVPL